MTEEDMVIPQGPPVDIKNEIAKAEAQRFAKPGKAIAAFTDEDAQLEAAIQNMHLSQDMTAETEPVALVTKEVPDSDFLGDLVDDYVPAKNINELESQVFQAKSVGADSIEASEEIIKYFTRKDYPEKQGFFMYKDVRVFIPGRASGFKNSDKGTLYAY